MFFGEAITVFYFDGRGVLGGVVTIYFQWFECATDPYSVKFEFLPICTQPDD